MGPAGKIKAHRCFDDVSPLHDVLARLLVGQLHPLLRRHLSSGSLISTLKIENGKYLRKLVLGGFLYRLDCLVFVFSVFYEWGFNGPTLSA